MKIRRIMTLPLIPIARNFGFFIFMYILGVVCAICTLPNTKGAELYSNLWLELFADDYIVCVLLSLIPGKVRPWIKAVFYFLLYSIAIADVYCFSKFGSTINPSMLLLLGETDSREAGEFLRTYLTPEILKGPVGFVVGVIILHTAWGLRRRIYKLFGYRRRMLMLGRWHRWRARWFKLMPAAGIAATVLFVVAIGMSWSNKQGCHKLMTAKTVGEIEHLLTQPNAGKMYLPVYRMAFSIRSNQLAAKQITTLIAAADKARVDSCSYASPCIVLIIGESYGRHHSSLYGYDVDTNPRQRKLEKQGRLIKFTDVVSPWNLTSFVFKNIFSMHVVGQEGEWCDYPMFPELMRKAGYHVTFITNQFLSQAKEAVYDFSGGFFLNNPVMSKQMFDSRNDTLRPLDSGLLKDYKRIKPEIGEHEFTIFHLLGQHVSYRQRYPANQRHFWVSTYDDLRPDLNGKQKRMLSDYDNATLYNDSIVDQIVKLYQRRDAVVIYMPDHGEECYEEDRGFICRNHSSAIDYDLAHYEFEIPFWVYVSPLYAKRHPQMVREIKAARNKRFMTDAVAHMLMHLAGISAPDYHEEYDILSPKYNEMRPRLLKGHTDYDKLREGEKVKK